MNVLIRLSSAGSLFHRSGKKCSAVLKEKSQTALLVGLVIQKCLERKPMDQTQSVRFFKLELKSVNIITP